MVDSTKLSKFNKISKLGIKHVSVIVKEGLHETKSTKAIKM